MTLGTHSYYHSLQVKLDHNFSNGFQLVTAYTYSKAIDFNNFQNIDWSRNKGLMDQDHRHVFSQSYVYEPPFGRGKRWAQSGLARWLLGDGKAMAFSSCNQARH